MLKKILLSSVLTILCTLSLLAQTATVRGNLFDKDTGEPIIYGNVLLKGTTLGANSDLDGFFTIADILLEHTN